MMESMSHNFHNINTYGARDATYNSLANDLANAPSSSSDKGKGKMLIDGEDYTTSDIPEALILVDDEGTAHIQSTNGVRMELLTPLTIRGKLLSGKSAARGSL
jgi:hypothetical protein